MEETSELEVSVVPRGTLEPSLRTRARFCARNMAELSAGGQSNSRQHRPLCQGLAVPRGTSRSWRRKNDSMQRAFHVKRSQPSRSKRYFHRDNRHCDHGITRRDSHTELFHVEHVCRSNTRVQWGTRGRREGAFSRETGPGRVYLPALVSAVSRAPFAVNMSPGPMCSTWNTPSLRHEQGPAHRMRPCCLPVIY